MDVEEKLGHVLELLDKLEVTVRSEPLGGSVGGACVLKGKVLVFIDLDADPETRYAAALSGLTQSQALDDVYILPEIRADLERYSL